jgi:hypothetical protein
MSVVREGGRDGDVAAKWMQWLSSEPGKGSGRLSFLARFLDLRRPTSFLRGYECCFRGSSGLAGAVAKSMGDD